MLQKLPHKNDPLLRLNAACPYFTMFPLDFPFYRLASANSTHLVLDPFCGRGTTLYAARLRGLASIGIDSNPVAAAIAQAKLASATVDDLLQLFNDIMENGPEPKDIPKGKFWDLCFHDQTLYDICKLREYFLETRIKDEEILLRAIILGVLHGPRPKTVTSYLSNQMPRTYSTKPTPAVNFWTKKDLKPKKVDTFEVIRRKATRCLESIPQKTDGYVLHQDSRDFKFNNGHRADWVVTSPPYYGMRTYVPDQWLRNWFLGGPADVTYDIPDQVSHSSLEDFIEDLAAVWDSVATACNPGAKLIVRFGAIPSRKTNPGDLLKTTIRKAKAPWRILTMKKAGSAVKGRRQADQFSITGRPVEEVDLYARLET